MESGAGWSTTCHDAIVTNGSFGLSLNTINGDIECNGPVAQAVTRLDDYCRATMELGADGLLGLDGCTGLDVAYSGCVADNSCPSCVLLAQTAAPTDGPTGPQPSASPTTPVVSNERAALRFSILRAAWLTNTMFPAGPFISCVPTAHRQPDHRRAVGVAHSAPQRIARPLPVLLQGLH